MEVSIEEHVPGIVKRDKGCFRYQANQIFSLSVALRKDFGILGENDGRNAQVKKYISIITGQEVGINRNGNLGRSLAQFVLRTYPHGHADAETRWPRSNTADS